MKARVVRFHATGGPEVLTLEETDVGAPGQGEVRIRHTAIGVNFIDVYHRRGLYPLPLPSGLGQEAAGVVEEVGPGAEDLAVGDRVAYAGLLGAYSTRRLVRADRLVKLPDAVDEKVAAGAMLKGMTARYLLRATTHVAAGDTVLIHAAAGGTGQILVQWAVHLGATVVAVVGSKEKAEVVRALGAQHVVVRAEESFVERVNAVTKGRGVDVVYDSVGKDTFAASLECLRVRGLMVSFGQASGPVPPFELSSLAKKCLYLTRPSLFAYTATRAELVDTASDLFTVIEKGVVRVDVTRTFSLAEVAAAHTALESRETVGSMVLVPS